MHHQSQQNHNVSINKCNICHQNYSPPYKQQIVICSKQHTVCNQCMNDLRSRPQCPFCGQNIRFDKLGSQIYPQISRVQPQPNSRTEIPNYSPSDFLQQPNQQRFSNTQNIYPSNSQDINQGPNPNTNNQNSGQYQPVPNQQLQSSISNQSQPVQPYPSSQIANHNTSVPQCHRLSRNQKFLVKIFLLHIPFIVMNFIVGIREPYSECMDVSYGLGALRVWLLVIGSIQICFQIAIITVLCLFCRGSITRKTFDKLYVALIVILSVKITVWAFVQLKLQTQAVQKHCVGTVRNYGDALGKFHLAMIFAVICIRFQFPDITHHSLRKYAFSKSSFVFSSNNIQLIFQLTKSIIFARETVKIFNLRCYLIIENLSVQQSQSLRQIR